MNGIAKRYERQEHENLVQVRRNDSVCNKWLQLICASMRSYLPPMRSHSSPTNFIILARCRWPKNVMRYDTFRFVCLRKNHLKIYWMAAYCACGSIFPLAWHSRIIWQCIFLRAHYSHGESIEEIFNFPVQDFRYVTHYWALVFRSPKAGLNQYYYIISIELKKRERSAWWCGLYSRLCSNYVRIAIDENYKRKQTHWNNTRSVCRPLI